MLALNGLVFVQDLHMCPRPSDSSLLPMAQPVPALSELSLNYVVTSKKGLSMRWQYRWAFPRTPVV